MLSQVSDATLGRFTIKDSTEGASSIVFGSPKLRGGRTKSGIQGQFFVELVVIYERLKFLAPDRHHYV